MDAYIKFALLAGLEDENCELNHGPDREKIPAVDYLVQPYGYAVNEIEQISIREMVVPVCSECVKALMDKKWSLFYCFECCSSQWIYRRFAKNEYHHNILWLRGCPHCTSEFGGLFFSDFKAVAEKPLLINEVPEFAVA